MAGDNESLNLSWTSDDELETGDASVDSTLAVTHIGGRNGFNSGEASSSGQSSSLFCHFMGMGFSEKMVTKAIKDNKEGNADSILESLLFLTALENSPDEYQDTAVLQKMEDDVSDQLVDESDFWSSDYEENCMEKILDLDSCPEIEESSLSVEDHQKLLFLEDMNFPKEEAVIAIKRCGSDASLEVLADYIMAAQLARAEEPYYVEPQKKHFSCTKKQKRRKEYSLSEKKRQRGLCEDDEPIRLPKPMVGFGVPTEPCVIIHCRRLPEAARGPPYFFYENVALAPKGVWDTISRFLYHVQPEFVDSKFFCAAARKRGYIHNLPIDNRFPILPLPHRTIHEALPLTKKWWPSWDTRIKLNCLQTAYGSAKLTERIRKALEMSDGYPSLHVQKFVLEQCKKWNLVWVGRNKVAPLEPDEVETLLGFPRNHTRGGGISRTDRYKSLGNSFQVDTVGYLLSPLKDLFPTGMNVLSLFSGIGGAEVALHRLGIPLKTVVSVEISEVNRNIVKSWWEQTDQKGTLKHISDVQQLTADHLEKLIHSIGGFDLIIGGSPCNNLAGSNRVSRDGLEGKESSLFFEYVRILDMVKCIMGRQV